MALLVHGIFSKAMSTISRIEIMIGIEETQLLWNGLQSRLLCWISMAFVGIQVCLNLGVEEISQRRFGLMVMNQQTSRSSRNFRWVSTLIPDVNIHEASSLFILTTVSFIPSHQRHKQQLD
jgi:hypothetical protein